MLKHGVILMVLAVLLAMVVLPVRQGDAATANDLEWVISNPGASCYETNFNARFTYTPTTDDGDGSDTIIFVITDAQGNAMSAFNINVFPPTPLGFSNLLVTGLSVNDNISLFGQVPYRPWTYYMVDPTEVVPAEGDPETVFQESFAYFQNNPDEIVFQETFDPATLVPSCAQELLTAPPAVTVSPNTITTTEAGTNATFTLALGTVPGADVTVNLSSSDTGEASVNPASLTFTPDNFTTPQTVTVTGVDDALIDGNAPFSITYTATGGGYDGFSGTVTGTNLDNDEQFDDGTLIADPSSLLLAEDVPGVNAINVSLAQAPLLDETVTVTIALNNGQLTVGTMMLQFTSANFSTPQRVDVDAVADGLAEGENTVDIVLTTSSSLGTQSPYNGLTRTIVATIFDQDNDIIRTVPNLGLMTIYSEFPQPLYNTANGTQLRNSATEEMFYPTDADGNGFDTYVITNWLRDADGTVWLATWMGTNNRLWVEYIPGQVILDERMLALING